MSRKITKVAVKKEGRVINNAKTKYWKLPVGNIKLSIVLQTLRLYFNFE